MNETLQNPVQYPFHWLDKLAEKTLNPEKQTVQELAGDQFLQIQKRLPAEFQNISRLLKDQTFLFMVANILKLPPDTTTWRSVHHGNG